MEIGFNCFSLLMVPLIILTLAGVFPNTQLIAERIKNVLTLIISAIMAAFGANAYPKVKIDENGLLIEFFWGWYPIDWCDVGGVQVVKSYFGTFKIWIVKSKDLTEFHRLYGLLNIGKFEPCFVIHPLMKNHLELIQKIKQHSNKRYIS